LIEEAAFAADVKPPIVVMAALETSSRRVVEGTTKDGNTTYPMRANKAHRMSTENALEDAMGQMSIVFFSDNFFVARMPLSIWSQKPVLYICMEAGGSYGCGFFSPLEFS